MNGQHTLVRTSPLSAPRTLTVEALTTKLIEAARVVAVTDGHVSIAVWINREWTGKPDAPALLVRVPGLVAVHVQTVRERIIELGLTDGLVGSNYLE
jgi:hypothetical protein